MREVLEQVAKKVSRCSCLNHNPIRIEQICVQTNAMEQLIPYLNSKSFKELTVICDSSTYAIAGNMLCELINQEGLSSHVIIVRPNDQGDVIADERSVVQVILEIPTLSTDCLLAVGSGTLHDIVRFIASKINKPFISIPTAPSVDGFTSLGAPLMINGVKKTISAVAPIAIFADLTILTKAPKSLIASGFGDMIGKYTSLVDWKFSHLIADEPYCEAAAQITQAALRTCIDNITSIAHGDRDGIEHLIYALIDSGLAMLLLGQSHPASGAEHHLSHYWETIYVKKGNRQLLHGAKVGVATAEISRVYHELMDADHWSKVKAQNEKDLIYIQRIQEYKLEMKSWIAQIPTSDQIRTWLRIVGGPTTPEELGIDSGLLQDSLQHAYLLRDRYTVMRASRELIHYSS